MPRSSGYHSAWIGEHHFNSLGVMSCPDLALAYIAAQTKSIRLAPAVTVLPLHHPIRVAEQWATLDLLSRRARRFRHRPRLRPRRIRAVRRAVRRQHRGLRRRAGDRASACGRATGRSSHHGKYYSFDDVAITPQPVQRPIPINVASFSRPTDRARGAGTASASSSPPSPRRSPWAASPRRRELYRDACAEHGTEARPAGLELFHPFRRHARARSAPRASARFAMAANAAARCRPATAATAPASYDYYHDFKDAHARRRRPEDLD